MIKNILCSLVFLVVPFLKPGYADEHFPYLAEVSKQSVNVRAGPNTNFEKLVELNKGAQVVVLGQSYEWLKVQPPANTKSYIRSDYLQMQHGTGLAVVTGNNVNVRCLPNSSASSLGELKKGTLVKVLGQSNGWSALAPAAGTAAWVHQDFLTEVSQQVPSSMLLTTESGETVQATPQEPEVKTSPVSPWVSMRGTVEALVVPLRGDVHYEIVMGDKSVFLLQDIPQISFFCNAVVNIDGAVVPDPQKKLMYPLLHINKIVLVL